MNTENNPPAATELNSPAELAYRKVTLRPPEHGTPLSPEATHQLLQELHSRQIELERQNEDLRHAQHELEITRAHYFDLYDLAPVGYCTLNDQGLIHEANHTLATLLGLIRSELITKPFSHFIFKEDQDVFYRLQQSVLILPAQAANAMNQSIVAPAGEVRLLRSDGSPCWVMLNASLSPSAQSEAKLRVVVTDITARKQEEEEHDRLTRHNQQQQKAESLSRMAGAIAHHFNNKLQAVMGNLDLALSDSVRTKTPDENLLAARKAAQQAAEVSTQMLTYLGHSHDQTEILNLSSLCQLSTTLLRATLAPTITLKTDLSVPGPRIKGNANQIKTVLTHLVTNAWESYQNKTGVICLSVKTVAARDIPITHRFPLSWQAADATYACMEVADSGCGIAGENIENLFDPFFSSKFTGRGLGLPMVLGIVKTHHGAISLKSRPNEGSAFRVYLPLTEASTPTSLAPFPAIPEETTVLVIENESAVRLALTLTLQQLRFKVLTANDGAAGVTLFQQNQAAIDCVLCDVSMPKMDGWETLATLRTLAPSVPVILCSGYHESLIMAGQRHTEQPDAFLGKPFGVEQLQHTLCQVLTNRKK